MMSGSSGVSGKGEEKQEEQTTDVRKICGEEMNKYRNEERISDVRHGGEEGGK